MNEAKENTPLKRWISNEISGGKFAELIGVQRHIGDEMLGDVWSVMEEMRDTKQQRDQWKAMAQELLELLEGNHHSGCSIQSPEEPHCDCGYQQGLEVALSRFNELNKP